MKMEMPKNKNNKYYILICVITIFTCIASLLSGCSLRLETPKNHGSAAMSEDTSENTHEEGVSITFMITCKSIDESGGVIYSQTLLADKGSTAFDVLENVCGVNGIPFSYTGTEESPYITSINNIKEFEHGMLSGWMYRVNGKNPNKSCGKYIVSQGDTIEFYYVTQYTP